MHDFVFYNHHLHNQFLCLEKEALSLLQDCTLPASRNFKAFITLWSSLIEELSFPSYFLISEVLISWVQGTLHKIVLKDEVYCCNHESPLARHKMLRFLQGHPDPTSFQKSPHPRSHVSLGCGILNYHNLFFFFPSAVTPEIWMSSGEQFCRGQMHWGKWEVWYWSRSNRWHQTSCIDRQFELPLVKIQL